jgi:hypothetical protein
VNLALFGRVQPLFFARHPKLRTSTRLAIAPSGYLRQDRPQITLEL